MNANTNNPTNTITLTVEKYQAMLETNMEQSMEITELRKTLKAEYDYAEGLIREIQELNKELRALKEAAGIQPEPEATTEG